MKLARNKLKIWDAKLAELSAIDIGSSFDPKFASERVPSLSEVLQLCKGKVGVIIELKYYGHDMKLEQRVVELVEKHGMASQIMAMSLKPEGVRKLKALRPSWKCGVLLSISVGNIQKIDADFLAINARFATRNMVARAHQAGKEIYAWTVDDPTNMSVLMNRGVDGILTNRPELARDVIAERSKMDASERFLIEIAALIGSQQPRSEQ